MRGRRFVGVVGRRGQAEWELGATIEREDFVDFSCAMSLDGTTVYLAQDHIVRSYGFPGIDGESTVYTDPTGFDIAGVTYGSDGLFVLLRNVSTGAREVRLLDETVIYTTAGTDAARIVWNAVDDRLYVIESFLASPDYHTIHSMLVDGSDVTLEYDSSGDDQAVTALEGPIVTPDGAVWFNAVFTGAIPSTTRHAVRYAAGVETVGGEADSALRYGVAHHHPDTSDVYQGEGTLHAAIENYQYVYAAGSITRSVSPGIFDGKRIWQSAASADFSKMVALTQTAGGATPDFAVLVLDG